jgi:hypothetical protein
MDSGEGAQGVLASHPPPASREQAVDEQEHDRSEGCHQDRPDVEARSPSAAQDPEQESPDHSARHADEGRRDQAPGIGVYSPLFGEESVPDDKAAPVAVTLTS